ncbi:urease accessory protein UreD [Streptomyces sp. NPDC048106]|uniref:urease accessory protein UreD n=1 Tax=Streptomyces sp. NPDC048106 TaxID=3155750 RepID=UPI00345557F3
MKTAAPAPAAGLSPRHPQGEPHTPRSLTAATVDTPAPSGDAPHATGPTPAHPAGVRATARLRATHNGRTTTVPLLHSDGPFHLRRLRPRGERARVCVLGAMSAPLGGDRLALDITAEAHTRLEVSTAAATLALRGPTPDPATYDVRLTVGEDASLHWLPQPLISAGGSTLHQTYRVELARTARLLLREEQLLGRSAEPPGHLSTRLTVRRDDRPILDQHTFYGAPAPAWDGPAVLADHRATGQLLLVTPDLGTPLDTVLIDDLAGGQCVLAPLADSTALLATAVAPTLARLRSLLDRALSQLTGAPLRF